MELKFMLHAAHCLPVYLVFVCSIALNLLGFTEFQLLVTERTEIDCVEPFQVVL